MIQSKTNEKIKYIAKLKQKKYRDQENKYLIYGAHLVQQAQLKGVVLEVITSKREIDGLYVSFDVMSYLSQTETTQEVMAVCKKEAKPKSSSRVLLLDDVQDPSNVGALIRSASAFGFSHVILGTKCADLYNEKVLRASKGAYLDCYITRQELPKAMIELKKQGYMILGADAHQTGTFKETDQIALVMGNEGQGLSSEVKAHIDGFLHIETEQVESLNVSVAGGILMHRLRRIK